MARASPRAVTLSFGLLTLALATLAGVGAWWLGVQAAERLGGGFTFDWYVYQPDVTIPAARAAQDVGLVAAGGALVAAMLALAFAHALWDGLVKRRKVASPPARAGAWSRGNAGLLAVALALVAPAVAYVLVRAAGPVPASGLDVKLVPATLFSAILAVVVVVPFAAWRLATGRTLPAGEGVNAIGGVALGAARFPRATIAVILVATLLLGNGASLIDTNVDVADVLPRGDHNSTAAKNLTTKFKSAFTQQVTWQFHVADRAVYNEENSRYPLRQTTSQPFNISDEVYIRALAEATEFVKSYGRDDPAINDSPLVGSVSLPDFYKLINWTIAGGEDASPDSFAIPPPTRDGEFRYRAVDEGVWRAVPETALAVMSADRERTQTAVVFNVDPQETLSSKEIGEWALFLRDEYVTWAEETPSASKVFTGDNAPVVTVDLPIANAHSSELAEKDFKVLLPIISVWILVCVFIAFRSGTAITIAFSTLVASTVWTFGMMGYLGIALNTLNLTIIPLIMGVGIDYGIHVINQYQEERSKGLSDREIFKRVGSHAGLALFVATLNTVVGLLVMVISPSKLIAELGILCCLAISFSYLLTITLIPAGLSLARGKAKARAYRPSPLMAGLADIVARNRVAVAALVLAMTAGGFVLAQNVGIEEFGDPPRNWLESDSLRAEHEEGLQKYYGTDEVKANVLVFEGDILDPAAHAYMDAIEASLMDEERDRIFHERIRTLPFLVRTYQTVRGGAPGAGEYIVIDELAKNPLTRDVGEGQDPYPATREEMRATLDAVFDSPLYQFGNLFIDHPDDRNAIMLVTVRARSYEDAREVWDQVWGAIEENEELRPAGMKVAFVGNTATNYLFIAKELPWLTYMSVLSNILVCAFVYIPTRDWRATVTVAVLNFATSLWWLALLPYLGVGLAITLTLPLVFIYAIGSDYGLHLAMAVKESGDLRGTFRTTGKAVLFSAITTFGAFLIYTQISNLAVRRTMIATAVAIVVIFVATLLIVPLLFGGRRYRESAEEAVEVDVVPLIERRRVVAVTEADPRVRR